MGNGSQRKILSNSVWIIIQHLYSMITALTIVALIARYLGPSDYGMINYCTSIITIFMTMSGLGLDNVIVSEIIRNPEKKGSYLGTALAMRLAASFISYPLILGVIALINPGEKTLLIVAALQAAGMILQTYEVLVYWFKIELKMKYISIAMICAITVTTVFRIILLVKKASVSWFALALSVQTLVAAIVVTVFFIRKSDIRLKVSRADAKALLKLSYNCIISSMSIIIYMHADKIILEKMTDTAQVGIYSAAVTLATYWQFIPMALIDSAKPVVLERRKSSNNEYLDLFRLVTAAITAVSFFFALLFSCLGWCFIYYLYGNDYLDAFIPLIILSWASAVAVTGYCRSIWIAGESYYRYEKRFTVSAAVINIILDILFIWRFGIIGAAVATLITYSYEVFIAPVLFKETRVFAKLYLQSLRMIPKLSIKSVSKFRQLISNGR